MPDMHQRKKHAWNKPLLGCIGVFVETTNILSERLEIFYENQSIRDDGTFLCKISIVDFSYTSSKNTVGLNRETDSLLSS